MDAAAIRREEILAKKNKLEELRRARAARDQELRKSKQDATTGTGTIAQPTPSREVDKLLESVLGVDISRPATPRISSGSGPPTTYTTSATQTLSVSPPLTVYEQPSASSEAPPKQEIITYDQGVQTEDWEQKWPEDNDTQSPERSEELRNKLRQEIEEEVRATVQPREANEAPRPAQEEERFPARQLSNEELEAVTASKEFQDFLDQSTKVIERALDEEYDLLTDYAHGKANLDDDDESYGGRGKRGRRVKESHQFWDERWSKKRMISDIDFSPYYPELLLASYTKNPTAHNDPTGLVQVWNDKMRSRPEHTFHASSDILTAKFSPFHPNLIVGGCYSGQVVLWDTRSKSPLPVQKTPLTGSGHTHPVYSINIVGTQNANTIMSCSTDGVVCGWSVDMLAQPQEFLELLAPSPNKTEDVAPLCMAFPKADPTYFLAGTEEGTIFACDRYERAGAKAGIDARIRYTGHAAPVMSLDFHPPHGQIDLGDLVLSASMDWSAKLWHVRPPAATGGAASGSAHIQGPVLDFSREDLVFDAKWSPTRPGIFALVDGAGMLEIWDLNADIEVPVQRVGTSDKLGGGAYRKRSLNRVAWERNEGKRVAVGGLDGVVTVFEVGHELGGSKAEPEEWTGVKKIVGKIEAQAIAKAVVNGK
ncbi:hypothetical protein BLS_000654 [Venturia inaequalis]|uniref:WD40 repeat-like protein n=1 Tax=Venturia inaequalis TaxID=5025 RepID=A0A8H3UWA7_VENIN|nr:hypothetical protein BLS_000654 [Venturia inaequalis]KAE9980111.1 hypothetical protein EG328_000476 [Venturia inaequalis]KAE9986942.1 hypothetical protein EG327_004092 [Venturia inaequalis]RDI89736.1 hypothetical protein Vi05172_g235 [Venturia inaequalis]